MWSGITHDKHTKYFSLLPDTESLTNILTCWTEKEYKTLWSLSLLEPKYRQQCYKSVLWNTEMIKIMGIWTSYLCPCFQEETDTTLYVLKYEHPEMLDIFEK